MADSLRRLRQLTGRRNRVTDEWQAAIREAVAEGHSLRTVAEAAQVTHPRVHQIVHKP